MSNKIEDATNDVIEVLADTAHTMWSGWMEYLFSKCEDNYDFSVTIPASLVGRWKRQMQTPYNNLPENEKESDRVEAERIMQAIGLTVTEVSNG